MAKSSRKFKLGQSKRQATTRLLTYSTVRYTVTKLLVEHKAITYFLISSNLKIKIPPPEGSSKQATVGSGIAKITQGIPRIFVSRSHIMKNKPPEASFVERSDRSRRLHSYFFTTFVHISERCYSRGGTY